MNEQLHKQLLQDLVVESLEGLDRYDHDLLALERGDRGPETLNSIFRVIHTIKGTSGSLGIHKIEQIAHVGENLLSLLREGKLGLTPVMITTLFAYADALREMLHQLEASGTPGETDYTGLLEQLQQLQSGAATAQSGTPALKKPPAAEPAGWGLFDDEPSAPPPPAPPVTPTAPARQPEPSPVEKSAPARPTVTETAIRVEVGQLDKLMNLVGELVLARNQILQRVNCSKDSAFQAISQRLNHITTELQEGVMKTRMQPIGNLWGKYPRIVRDVAQELGKQVQLEMVGKETELDRTILEAIKDPLTHILRNSIDHGLESPDARRAACKPAPGLLHLRAYHEGGQVNIEITDDGAGINVARVKQKSVEKGLITADQAARMNDREVFNLIFRPGLSTAEKVSNVSGRGVGMDVVKTNIEKIGGAVDVQSQAGRGMTIKIKIPLTLAIIPALIVSSGGERFAIPQVNLLELVRVERDSQSGGVENVFNAPVYRLRGRLLPLVSLDHLLRLPACLHPGDTFNIVVLQADGRQFGLIVDAVNDTEEIVVKPLGHHLRGLTSFAGATIMGDGKVALILDVLGLAQQAQVVSENREQIQMTTKAPSQRSAETLETLLLFSAGDRNRIAMPLSAAARLEEFPGEKIERAGRRAVVQYRDQILPLIRVADLLNAGSPRTGQGTDTMLQVVVYSEQGHSVGLVVDSIDDIVETNFTLQHKTVDSGLLGATVVHGKVTDVLDVKAVIRAAEPTFFDPVA